MMYQDIHIHGGVVESVQAAGDVIIHGGVVERLTAQGDCKQYGGIIERRIIMGGGTVIQQPKTETEPKVIYRDRVVYKDRVVYRDRPQDPKISSLQSYNNQLSAKLRRANDQIGALNEEVLKLRAIKQVPPEASDDDVLIQRINYLKSELDKEREAHRKEVEELKWRLEAITDIANGRNERLYEDETNGQYIGVTDESLDVLFTLINEYPIAIDSDLTEEYGISMSTLKYIAKVLRLAKSPEQRREARERLRQHNIDIIERRGGDQGNHSNAKPVDKVGRYGKLIKSYTSIKAAEADCHIAAETIRGHCERYPTSKRYFTKDGFTFRYKK